MRLCDIILATNFDVVCCMNAIIVINKTVSIDHETFASNYSISLAGGGCRGESSIGCCCRCFFNGETLPIKFNFSCIALDYFELLAAM